MQTQTMLIVLAAAAVVAIGFFLANRKRSDATAARPPEPAPVIPITGKPTAGASSPAIATNPFVDWKAAGFTLFDIMTAPRFGFGRGFTDAEKALAREAGYQVDAPPSVLIDRSGSEFGSGGGSVLVRAYRARVPETFNFTVHPQARSYRIACMGAPGRVFHEASVSIDGGPKRPMVGMLDAIYESPMDLEPGPHTAAVEVDIDSQNGVQFQQWSASGLLG
jgi:hypothetical protein